MNSDIRSILLLGLAVIIFGCEKKTAPEAPVFKGKVVAWVGEETVTEEELLAELLRRGVAEPDGAAKEETLSQLVEARRIFLAGKEKGYHADEEAMLAARRNVGIRVQREFEKKLESIPVPTKEEITAFYEKHSEEYQTQAAALGAILVRKENPETARKALNEFLENNELPEDGTFGDFAEEYSHDPTTRVTQGRMRWINPSQKSTSRWPEPIFDTLFQLKNPREVSPVTLLPDGAFVVRLIDKQSSQPISIERVSAEISARIYEEKRVSLKQEFREELEAKFPVRYPN